MKYTTKKCPNCRFAYVNQSAGDQRKYGSPLRKCPKCGTSFWDTDVKEPALYAYENLHETVKGFRNVVSMIIYGVTLNAFGIGSVCLLFYFGISEDSWACWLFIAVAIYIDYLIISHIKQKNDEKKRWPEIVKERQAQYDQSMIRLQDEEYLKALAQVDRRAKQVLNSYQKGEDPVFAPRPHV